MRRLIEVDIFGQTFTVNSEDDEKYVRQLASYVDQRMRQVGGTAVLVERLEQSEKMDGIATSESTVNPVTADQRVPTLEKEEKKEILPPS